MQHKKHRTFFLDRQVCFFFLTTTFSVMCIYRIFDIYFNKGTGKTRTLVAAIEQIVRLTDRNVLVCAQSNAACDEIANRLIPALSVDEMFRMYAISFDVKKLDSNIKPYSNCIGEEFHYPSLKFLMKYRVLVCTLCTAGTLTRASIPSKHFSYVIIDECASAHETMALIPIAGKSYLILV